MMLLALVLLVLMTAGLLLRPLLLRAEALPPRHSQDMAIYQAQLEDLRRDADAQKLEASEAQTLTLELQRRLLRSERRTEAAAQLPNGLPTLGLALTALALLAGAGLYLALGNPGLPERPTDRPPPDRAALMAFTQARDALEKGQADSGTVSQLANALVRMGEPEQAVSALRLVMQGPGAKDPELWVARGEALLAQSNGLMSPAARMAFDEASKLAPGHPAPRFYLALAWLQAGRPQEAIDVLEALKAESKPDAPWMPALERRLNAARTMLGAGIGRDPLNAKAPPKPISGGPGTN
jgi:cytochrome c-type biogenesis protein CcmH